MNSPCQLEMFPDELFLELFSYLPSVKLYHAWYGLNHRFNAILRSVRISLDLVADTPENNRLINYFSRQILYVHIRTPWNCLDFRQFPNLRSLVIDTELTKKQVDSIQPEILPFLRRLTFTDRWKCEKLVNDVVFDREDTRAWIRVYHLPLIPDYFFRNPFELSHIQTMIFDRVTSVDVHLILSLQTTLRRLKVTIVSPSLDGKLSKISFYNRKYQHQHLIDFHSTINTYNKLDDLHPFLSHLPSLRYLHIACDSLTINDFQQLALELNTQVPRLERFNCTFKQTYIKDMKKIHCMSPLFVRMTCRKVEWIGGWHYHCVTTENVESR